MVLAGDWNGFNISDSRSPWKLTKITAPGAQGTPDGYDWFLSTIHVASTGGDTTPGGHSFVVVGGSYSNQWGGMPINIDDSTSVPYFSSNMLGPTNSITFDDGFYYSFRILAPIEWNVSSNLTFAVMKTSAPPVSVSVTGQTPTAPTSNDSVVVSIVTSQPKSPQERIYLRWSTDTFITSHMVQAVGSGVNYSAVIPAQAQPAGTSVQYCITTSTADLSQVSTSGRIDFLTLATTSNTHFVVAPGTGATPTPTATRPPTPTATPSATATPTQTPTPTPTTTPTSSPTPTVTPTATPSPGLTPAAPSNLSATAAGCLDINLSWIDNSNNETGFKIERSVDNVTFNQIATTSANITTYTSHQVSAGLRYFRVRAYNANGDSPYSNTVSSQSGACPTGTPTPSPNATPTQTPTATPTTTPTPSSTYTPTPTATATATPNSTPTPTPTCTTAAAPSNLVLTVGSSTQINLNWTDNSNNEQGFYIGRSTDGVNFTRIATVGANVTSYASGGLSPCTTYTYRVKVFNSCGEYGFSNNATATTLGCSSPTPTPMATATPTATFTPTPTSTATATATATATPPNTPTPTPTATATATFTPTPTPGQITLTARGYKMRGEQAVDLSWTRATSSNVDVYRNGVVVATTPNDGLYTDSPGGRSHASYTYKVCNAGTQTCSSQVTVTF